MNRDHLLGWPPALLALDPEPRVSQRTPVKPPVSAIEEQARRDLDAKLTKSLSAPVVVVDTKPVLASKPDYEEVTIEGVVWRIGGKPPHPGYWLAGERGWVKQRKSVDKNYCFWDGQQWFLGRTDDDWRTGKYASSLRPPGQIVVYQLIELKL